MKVHGIVPLLRSEHFADVVDVYPRGDGLSFMFVLAGSPAPPPSPVFADVSASWLQALPSGKRAKLEAALSAAATPHEQWQLLKASAEGDHTKVRAAAKRVILYHDTGRSPRSPRGSDES